MILGMQAAPRRHKMVFVDFSNPFLRSYLASAYGPAHQRHLDAARAQIPQWATRARAVEAERGGIPRPLAAVLDIDEVILANIHMNSDAASGFHACDYYAAPDGKPWPRDDLRLNPLLPGARAFIDALLAENIKVVFLTGRLESIRDETVENFGFVGLAGDGAPFRHAELMDPAAGRLIMYPDAEYPTDGGSVRPFKENHRHNLEKTHHIVLNIGDQVSDLGLYGDVQIQTPHPFYYTR
jgi:predicted secreted acid phosphatase